MFSPKIQNQTFLRVITSLSIHTKVWIFVVIATTLFSFFFSQEFAFAATGINDQISFQGKVVNTNGTNVANGNYDFVFKLYTVSSAGTAVWTETWNSGTSQVTVTDGIFQVNLGTHTDLPGSIDFNTDNIYLGIEFNGDGEMSPRVHFTAAPYAFNAAKVGGLTVTDTTGTLTIPNGETISFGGSFTTSASNDVTLTTSGATNVTLPTTGTLATLDGTEILTNKTIGSTGLTFSGASTDITTASGESLVIVAAGAGTIDLQDATTADSLTLDSGGLTLQNSEVIGNGTDDFITFTGAGGGDNTDLYLDLDGTAPVLYSNTDVRVSVDDFLNVQVSGVTGAAAGDIWYDSAANKFKINENGTTKILCNATDLSCGSGGGGDLQTSYGLDADGSDATISLTTADDSLIFTNPTASGTDSAFLLHLNQQHTTGAVSVLDITQASSGANAVNITANAIDSETGLALTTNALTSGSALAIASSASAFTGNLASITLSGSNAANTGSLLALDNTGTSNANTSLYIKHYATGTNNLAFRIDDVSGDTTPFVVDGSGNVGIGDSTPDAVLDFNLSSTNGTAGSEYGAYFTTSDTGTVSTGTDNTYGLRNEVTRTGATGGTLNTYGISSAVTSTFASGSGTINSYGIASALTANTNGTSVGYGFYTSASGADTTYGYYADVTASSGSTATYGYYGSILDGGATANTNYGSSVSITDLGNVSSGTDTNYGTNTTVSRTSATGGTLNTYGNYTSLTNTFASGSGTITGYGDYITATGSTTGDSTLYGSYVNATGADFTVGLRAGVTAISAGDAIGVQGIINDATTGANSNRAFSATMTDSGVVTTGTDTNYGQYLSISRFGATGGTINTYGDYITVSSDNAGSGTSTLYGSYINTDTASSSSADTVYGSRIETEANSGTTAYGLYVDVGSELGTEYSGIFMNGNFGIGDATPDNPFEIASTSTQIRLSYTDGSVDGTISVDSNEYLLIAAGTTSEINRVQVGAGGAGNSTPDFFGLDVKNDTGDPAGGFEGAMYYNTFDNVFRCYQNSGWTNCIGSGGSGIATVRESDSSPSVGSLTTLEFGPATTSSEEFIVADQTGGVVRVTAGTMIGKLNEAETVTAGWTFNTAATTFATAINANGGITFDAATDTVGAFTAAGTIDLSTNILTNIGNSGTDFVASTGALTLAGVLSANGGITLASSQSFTASALAYMDLGSIVHNTTAVQGLRLPQAASASPSSPSAGEGYLAWDAGGNQIIYYNGSAWSTISGGSGYNLIKDESTSLTARTTLAFLGAGVTCADNVTQTECTIAGGSGSDLQGTYDADANGSNATISLTAADDGLVFTNPTSGGTDGADFLLHLNQQHTSDNVTALKVTQASSHASANAVTVEDEASDTTPFIINGNGRVGIGTSSVNTSSNTKLGLQVGSGTNRSDVSIFGDVKAEGYDIQRSLSGIIDIFVYDTSRDTDGGEWRDSRYILQNSWATETKDDGIGDPCDITIDDRCGSSSFPRKAILVTTASALYIFDASDNTMWMKFTQAGTYSLGADTNNNPSGVGAQNGVIVVGTNGSSATGMYAFDFKQDIMYRYNATNRVQGDVHIGSRNSTVTYATDANTNLAILDAVVNDVSIAMQTSSNEGAAGTLIAPIDSQAGPVRGVTLIAAATDTGVSVVHMGPREVFNYSDATGNDYNQVVVTSRGRMYATNEALAQLEEWKNIDKDPASEVNGTPDRVYDETVGKSPITTGTVPTMSTSPGALAVIERGSSAREAAAAGQIDSGDIVFVGTNQGLAEVHTSGGTLVAASWSKLTTTTVATPYMNGAVRSAFLFDDASGATSAVSAIGSGANVMDTAGATSPTFGQGGVRGNSVNFNNNSYLCSDANIDGTCDNDTDYNLSTTSFTVSMWFKHGTTAALDTLFDKCWVPATPAATSCAWGGMTASGAIAFGIDDDATWTVGSSMDDMITSSALYNDNQWHHAIFTNTDTDICLYIDGRQAVACDSTLAATATLELGAAAVTIGGTCSGANCVTGTNFWDGSIDDFTWNSNAGTTAGGLTAQSANKMYLDGRAHLIRPATTVTDATAFSSTTIGDSGEVYIPGSFVGLVVELTSGTGSGQTRTIVANDDTTFTVYPAFSVTPDATTDYRVSPAKLYGSSNNVTAIGVDLPTSLNRVRKVYIGTSDGSDGGGITTYTNAGAGSIKTEVIHSDAGYSDDDLGTSWSGTDADDISAIGSYSDTIVFGNGTFFRSMRRDVSLKQLQTEMIGSLEDVRQQLVASGLFGATQDVLGLGQGADLAENYYSPESLQAGEIVALDSSQEAGIKRSHIAYQRDVLGIVATKPAIVMGSHTQEAYPVALVGRVPVRVTNENGPIYAGDRITASATPGYGMYAHQAGRVIGEALADAGDWEPCAGESTGVENQKLCTTVLVFVNLSDYSGPSVELAMAKRDAKLGADGLTGAAMLDGEEQGLTSPEASIRLAINMPTKQEKILAFLKEMREKEVGQTNSEIFTGRVAASTEVITPVLFADQIFAKSIKAESIEGLEIWTDQLLSLQAKYAGLAGENGEGTVPQSPMPFVQSLKTLSLETLTVSLDTNLLGKLSVVGGITVTGNSVFQGETTFERLATFFDTTFFKGNVAFEGTPTFNRDTAGFAVIEKGARRVEVKFENTYAVQPVVSVALTNDRSVLLSGNADSDLQADLEEVEKDFVNAVFDADLRYIVTDKNADGFIILLNQDAPRDVQFSWVALAVNNANSFQSEKEKKQEVKEEEIPTEENEIIPEPTSPISDIPPVEPTETPAPTSETI